MRGVNDPLLLAGKSLYSNSQSVSVSAELNYNRSPKCWTTTRVCAVTTPLHILYQESPNYGPEAKSDPRSHFIRPQTHFAKNEKIIYDYEYYK